MTVYLRANPPRRSQFRVGRRAKPTGATVLHSAESVLDTVGPDTGAEAVARFMVGRAEPGSYHDLGDSDSSLQLVNYSDEAYQDGTGSNPWALSISFALRASDWPKLTPAKRAAFLAQGAKAFARQQVWLKANGHPMTPLRRITRAQSEAGAPGFITHGDRDPGRRSDPGAGFPWDEWYAACLKATGSRPSAPSAPAATVEVDISRLPVLTRGSSGAFVKRAQAILAAVWGAKVTPDGAFGPATEQALRAVQAAAGVPVTGKVDRATWHVLILARKPTAKELAA